jgi:hypothetical protein
MLVSGSIRDISVHHALDLRRAVLAVNPRGNSHDGRT